MNVCTSESGGKMYQNSQLSVGDILDALNSPQRREVLLSVMNDSPVARPETDSQDRRRALRMNHCHLPKLAKYSLIEESDEGDQIRAGPNLGAVQPMLEFLSEYEMNGY